ncbi:hypothetical protein [Streptomyces sp. NPDC058463]|uniref:hypothetical protein n=1 Tax=Streptomyces sp. NPDC058463 TaxID=3346510 RepID=UPI00366686B3
MSTSSATIVSAAATLTCPHGGRASATTAHPAVRLDGQPVHTASDTFVVTGCPHTVDGAPHPCTTLRWSPQPGGVLIDGSPVLLHTSAAHCYSAAHVQHGPPVVHADRQGATCR